MAHSVQGAPESIRYIRKPVKRLTIRVRRGGEVVVTIPAAMPQAQVEAFVAEQRDWIARKQQELAQLPADETDMPLSAPERRALLARVEALVARHAPRLQVQVADVRLKTMRTRWGSCNIRARRIWINTRLARYPEICLEAVVVHELVHLIERGHTPRFYALMDRFYPAWREADRLLNGRVPRRAG